VKSKKAKLAETEAEAEAKAQREAVAQAEAEKGAEQEVSYDPAPEGDREEEDKEEGEASESESDSKHSGYDSEGQWVHCSSGVKILHAQKDPFHDEKEDYEPEMEPEFDPVKFECKWWMKPHECMLTLLGRAKAAESNTSQSAAATVLHIGDTKHLLLKAGNIGVEGFKSLRDCLADLRRNGRTILRDVLITEESV
jgi:hypothetical protein